MKTEVERVLTLLSESASTPNPEESDEFNRGRGFAYYMAVTLLRTAMAKDLLVQQSKRERPIQKRKCSCLMISGVLEKTWLRR